jgi:DNA-binding NtrC family response regulator
MPHSMQVKLLRVLQDRQIYMIGAKTPRKVNVRVVAATNKDLRLLVRQGSFREDLFYRLNVLPIELPPLRERSGDIMPLLSFFLNKYAVENARKVPSLEPEALRMMQDYHWPGNVRELENLVYRLVILSDAGVIKAIDLPDYMKFCLPRKTDLSRSLDQVETDHIKAVLTSVDGNKSRAATILGINRKTLHLKLSALESQANKEK